MIQRRVVSILILGFTLLLTGCRSTATPLPPLESAPTETPGVIVILPTPTSKPTPDLLGTPVIAGPTPGTTPTPGEPVSSALLGQRQEGGELGRIWSLANLRYGEHEDRLRLVIEMAESGTSVPRYTAVEVDNALKPFPGDVDPDWGSARIDIVISDLYAREYPLASELPLEMKDRPVTVISRLPTFDDARLGFSIWLTEPAEFEIHELTEPVRIVVDVIYP
ncbi:MAG: hypothetical protein ACLFU8_13885 [Anaerolineales bacterium]